METLRGKANILAVIGKIIDDNNNPNSVGPWQKGLGYANDAISLFAPPGDKYTSLGQLNYFLNDPVIGYNTAINTWVPAGVDAINSITIP